MTFADARTSTRTAIATILVLAALVVLAPAAGAATSGSDSVGFGVAPLRFDVDASPGQSSSHQVVITNTDTVATTFTFSKEDFQGDKDEPAATPVLLGGKFASDISGYDWITPPDAVTIPAGQQRTVSVKVSVPSGATGGHYAALIVAGAARDGGENVLRSRMGVLFMMNAGGVPPPDIVITEITQVGPTRTVTKYTNGGQTEVTPKPVVIVRDPITHKIIRKATGSCTTALPGGSGLCEIDDRQGGTTVSHGGVTSGAEKKYVDLVGDPTSGSASGELPTEWAGAWTSMLLPLVGVALFALYFLFLRRRRKDGEGEDSADVA